MKLYKPLEYFDFNTTDKGTLFLAGSIENGEASFWQDHVIEQLENTDITIFNPRRDDWDSTWEQSINNINFKDQVEWEQHHLLGSANVIFYFEPGTKSPISLMELGQVTALSDVYTNLVVICPDGFWKKGNIEIVCSMNFISVYNTLDEGINALLDNLM